MPVIIKSPSRIKASGTKEKIIEEFFGSVKTGDSKISIAKMKSPEGWEEPGQTPEFDEYTVVLKGELKVATKDEVYFIKAGQAVLCRKGEWIKYSTPNPEGAEYIAVCLPAFSPDTVHRDSE